MRIIFFCFLLVSFWGSACYAQHDSLATGQNINAALVQPLIDSLLRDSITKANRQQFMADSIAMFYLMADSLRENQFISKIFEDDLSYYRIPLSAHKKQQTVLKTGLPFTARDQWVIAAIIGLLIYTALLNIFLGDDIKSVLQSFYNKQSFSQTDKEGGLINSWAFIGLFILFSLTCGLVLYQLTAYRNLYYEVSGFQLFITFSVVIGLLFALKFLVLKFIGFIFDINSIVSQYIAILNLTYFNIAFVLLFVSVCFSLLASHFIHLLINFTLGAIVIIFALQYIRNGVSIISNIRFHKFYLFIYLCALEICPILILIKALNI
jgi:hypothetical protein